MSSDQLTPAHIARTAYDTIEPFHVLAYFNPGLRAAHRTTGLDPQAFYVGARGAPLGPCSASVVSAAFFNFAPDVIAKAWSQARAVGLDAVSSARYRMLDEQLRAILGPRIDDEQIRRCADVFTEAAQTLPLAGRPLAAAWAASEQPPEPHLRLWHSMAVLREWRGDNHIAALVVNGLNGFDAAVFHEAQLLDPSVKRRVMGHDMMVLTRGWAEQDWQDCVDRLVARGLVERTADGHRLTATGSAVYDDIEATTDALGEQLWAQPELSASLASVRPYVKAVIDAGVLPGTTAREG